MAALFAQMWALELAAFLLGAAVTWLAFVPPARAAAKRAAQPVLLLPAWQSRPSPDQPVPSPREPEAPTPTADPALANSTPTPGTPVAAVSSRPTCWSSSTTARRARSAPENSALLRDGWSSPTPS